MKDLNQIFNRYIALWMNTFAQIVNRQKTNFICVTDRRVRTNKIFESFVCWTGVLLNISAPLTEIDSDEATPRCPA